MSREREHYSELHTESGDIRMLDWRTEDLGRKVKSEKDRNDEQEDRLTDHDNFIERARWVVVTAIGAAIVSGIGALFSIFGG